MHDSLDDLLMGADPARCTPGPAIADALDALGKDITMEAPSVVALRPRRRRYLVAVGGVVAAAVLGTGVAAASGLFAHTGRQASGGENGTGEVIRLDAPDTPQALAELAAGLPLPPGVDVDELARRFVTDEPTEQAQSGLRASLEFVAACEWTGYWLRSSATGDEGGMASAQAVLDQVPTWAALNAADGGGVIDSWRHLAEVVRTGDADAVADEPLYVANCR